MPSHTPADHVWLYWMGQMQLAGVGYDDACRIRWHRAKRDTLGEAMLAGNNYPSR